LKRAIGALLVADLRIVRLALAADNGKSDEAGMKLDSFHAMVMELKDYWIDFPEVEK
jgi:hypothetical protein